MIENLTYPETMSMDNAPLPGGALAYVNSPARIAVYDDLLSSPRIIDIPPNRTKDFIGALASSVYNEAREAGGSIPFTVILQVTENFTKCQESLIKIKPSCLAIPLPPKR